MSAKGAAQAGTDHFARRDLCSFYNTLLTLFPSFNLGRSLFPSSHLGRSLFPSSHLGRSLFPSSHLGRSLFPSSHLGRSLFPSSHLGRSMFPSSHLGGGGSTHTHMRTHRVTMATTSCSRGICHSCQLRHFPTWIRIFYGPNTTNR